MRVHTCRYIFVRAHTHASTHAHTQRCTRLNLQIQRILSASRLGRALLIGEDNELLQLSPMPGA